MKRAFLVGICLVLSATARGEDWPQWMGPNRDSNWTEKGIIDSFPKDGPKVKWRVKISGGYAGPAVANGKVYVMDYVTNADVKKETFDRTNFKGSERVLCFQASDGKLLWEHKYDCRYTVSYPGGPRCTPTVHEGKVYTLGTEGNLFCLDAEKGTVLWSKDFKVDYKAATPIWGFCGHPLVDGKKLFCLVGGEGAVAVAFDKDTGKEIWKALTTEEPGYCPPTMITAGGKKQLLIWHPESANSLNPETGEKYWSVKLTPQFRMSIAAPRQLGDLLYIAGIGDQAVCLKLDATKPAVTEVWRGAKKTGVYAVNSTPYLENGMIYGVCEPGVLRAVKLDTGARLWESAEAVTGKERGANSATSFIVKNGDRFFLFSETGHLIIAKLTPEKYEEISRTKILEPTSLAFGRDVVWSHPAYANRCVFARNDKELVCVDLAK